LTTRVNSDIMLRRSIYSLNAGRKEWKKSYDCLIFLPVINITRKKERSFRLMTIPERLVQLQRKAHIKLFNDVFPIGTEFTLQISDFKPIFSKTSSRAFLEKDGTAWIFVEAFNHRIPLTCLGFTFDYRKRTFEIIPSVDIEKVPPEKSGGNGEKNANG